jgi:formamidopyrimidine-DNA glycosylase
MPELPEVEVTRRQIERLLRGRVVARVETTADSSFFLTSPRLLRRRLRGRRVECVERLGKYLLARLDDGGRLLLHLGMTGQIFGSGVASLRLLSAATGGSLSPERQLQPFRPDLHTHLRLRFGDGGPDVFFRDVRKFGKVQLLEAGETSPRIERLGIDALRVKAGTLFLATRGRRTSIKALLLDQSLLAGVGNIYADEALHLAGVRPGRRASRLTREEARRLAAALRLVLRQSIEAGGSSIEDFLGPDGSDGLFQEQHHVYGRTGEPCRRCRTPIVRRLVAQRSSHYCPRCQR